MSINTDQMRAAFLAWIETCPGHPSTGSRLDLMWFAWQAALSQPQGEPAAYQVRSKWERNWNDAHRAFYDKILETQNPDYEVRALYPAPQQDEGVTWPKDQRRMMVQVFYIKDACMFVCGISGHVVSDTIPQIEEDLADSDDAIFDKGDGEYLFSASWDNGQYGEEGRCEIAPYWECTFVAFKPLEDEAALKARGA